MSARPSTPPPARKPGTLPPNPITPEQIRRTEEARLRAKALRTQHDANRSASTAPPPAVAGQKRAHSEISTNPRSVRDASSSSSAAAGSSVTRLSTPAADAAIRPAKKFDKYVEYDLSAMTDTKGGFLNADDDPRNRALHGYPDKSRPGEEAKPANMSLAEWERHLLLKRLRAKRAGPFEPGLSVLEPGAEKVCAECGTREIDWQWEEVFGVFVCHSCKDKVPEKYSLLTKTEAREDYLLTDEELKDSTLLPHLERPNPHKSTWNNMMLFLRGQVEAYAFSEKRWGSAENLDKEFERRESEKKKRKEQKFKNKLEELKKKTRVEAYRRARKGGDGVGKGAQFGDRIVGRLDRHEHEWGRGVTDRESGVTKKRCVECGMEVEELEF